MEDLIKSIRSLQEAIKTLNTDADHFYSIGDNFRGNIRFDAANRLTRDLENLMVAEKYIKKSLNEIKQGE